MIRHVVMWTFADKADGTNRTVNVGLARAHLEKLDRLVPGMRHLEVVVPPEHLEHTHDLMLVVDFDSETDLAAYATHPRHVEVASFIRGVTTGRACIDYET